MLPCGSENVKEAASDVEIPTAVVDEGRELDVVLAMLESGSPLVADEVSSAEGVCTPVVSVKVAVGSEVVDVVSTRLVVGAKLVAVLTVASEVGSGLQRARRSALYACALI